MEPPRQLLALGQFAREEHAYLESVAREAQLPLVLEPLAARALRFLEKTVPRAIVVADPEAEAVVLEARASSRHAKVPVLALAAHPGDLDFAAAFGWGADDVVTRAAIRPLVSRLRALPPNAVAPPKDGRGDAIIAEPDRSRRVLLGRVLRNAGYNVTFAASRDETIEYARDSTDLVVLSAEVGAGPHDVIVGARAIGSRATWVVLCPPRELRARRNEVEALDRVAVTDGYAPAENVLFVSNELLRGGRAEQRTSARLLYGTTVSFRGAGRPSDDYGFSYNISEGGLYVRTLAPPEDETVWLELMPPRSERRVRLDGRVVWRRGFGNDDYATVPPGFGVQIIDASRSDVEAWQHGYGAFAQAVG